MLGVNPIVGAGALTRSAPVSRQRFARRDQVVCCVLRRGRRRHRVASRSHEHGCNLEAAGRVRLREQRLRAGDAGRVRDSPSRTSPTVRPRYGMPGEVVDGRTSMAVYDAAATGGAARPRWARVRRLIECKTYRYYGHHQGDEPAALSDGRRRAASRAIAIASSGFGEHVVHGAPLTADGDLTQIEARVKALDRRSRRSSPKPAHCLSPHELYRPMSTCEPAMHPWIAPLSLVN